MKTTSRDIYAIPGTDIEVELPYTPSFIMDFKDPIIRVTADKVIVGYLADDRHCENPLTSCDGMGAIYECRRHGSTLRDYEEALGLYDGGPNLDLVNEEDVVRVAVDRILADEDLKAKVLEGLREGYEAEEGESADDFIARFLDSENEVGDYLNTYDIRVELWREGRNNGTIGDKHAVLLDVYEHGGISYSVSGEGMQCQFDTVRAGAVWVPDQYAREEIVRRGAVYQKGDVNELRDGTFEVKTLREDLLKYDGSGHPAFTHWYEAYQYLEGLQPAHQRDPLTAERIAAAEIAKSAAEEYTSWANGNCFGVVVATYDPEGKELEQDSCWGFIGDDYAYQALQDDYFPKEA